MADQTPTLKDLLDVLGVTVQACEHERAAQSLALVLTTVVARCGGALTLDWKEVDDVVDRVVALRATPEGLVVTVLTEEQAKAESDATRQNAPSTRTPQ